MIYRDLCKTRYDKELPSWPCPACDRGVLRPKNPAATPERLPGQGVAYGIGEGYIGHDDDEGVFTARFVCQMCDQGVVAIGDYKASMGYHDHNGYEIDYRYTVRDIHPAPRIIPVPEDGTPEPVAGALRRAFALYWRDPQACAATIRVAIEAVVDHLGVGRKDPKGGGWRSLERRLQLLGEGHTDLVEAARAIKGLGNEGAHGDAVDLDKLLDAFELIEFELRRLFADEAGRRRELLARLTPKKGG